MWRFIERTLTVRTRSALANRYTSHFYAMYYRDQINRIKPSILETGEVNNFIYDLNGYNVDYMVDIISCAIGKPFEEIEGYVDEVLNDSALHAAGEMPSNIRCGLGRRMGWYALARATKPKVIVETGVERGHGALTLCAALMRNAAEGNPGRYFGTDLDPHAGRLFKGKYAAYGHILYGDSIRSLTAMAEPIDFFINDSDHSADYEYREYQTVWNKLAPGAIIVGDNAHASNKLELFSREMGRGFLYFQEKPVNHWYPGAGIGISFPKLTPTEVGTE